MSFDLRLLNPAMWLRNHRTNKRWDKWLSYKLEVGARIEETDSLYTVEVDGVEVWVANWPYAYGHPCPPNSRAEKWLPSRATSLALRDAVGEIEKRRADEAFERITGGNAA